MSDRMTPISFEKLMDTLLVDVKNTGKAFGDIPVAKAEDITCPAEFFGQKLDNPLGVAAGPQTQLASNVLACYLAGARVFELKTVQELAGEDLPIDKPCIRGEDEVYNVEWSTELTVADARDEYIKAWFAVQVAAKEFGLGTMEGVHFNMSVGYDLKGIQSPSVTDFLDTLNEAKNSACWNECQSYLRANLDRFENIDEAFLDSIPSKICQSVAVSTMHGCPPEQISEILLYLIEEKKYHTLLKCNPTLVGEETARALLDNAGYGYMVLDPDQFAFDLKFEQAVPLIKELAEAAKKAGVQFAVKLSNTLPVSIKEKELPGDTMYMSGKSLYPLTITAAKRLTEALGDEVHISYCGGADRNNIQSLYRAGLFPITVCSVLLQAPGVAGLNRLGALLHAVKDEGLTGPNPEKIAALADGVKEDKNFKKSDAKKKQWENRTDYHAVRQPDSLRCRVVCGMCEKVCPNRANEVLQLADGSKLLVHYDTLCNYCGCCQFVCPEPCHPYEDRLNFFSTEEELRGSDNQGLMQTANGYLFREGDTVKEVADRNALPELYKLALDAFEQAHPRNDA